MKSAGSCPQEQWPQPKLKPKLVVGQVSLVAVTCISNSGDAGLD